MGLLKKALAVSALTVAGGYGSAYYFFPELHDDQYQLYKAVERGARLFAASIKMAYYYELSGLDIHEKHKSSANVLLDVFKKNGGVYLKFGQIFASLDVLAPREYIEILSELFQSCPTTKAEDVRYIFEKSTNRKIEDVFSEFDWIPFSSASIAQVHEARLRENGERVAVKIQHRWLKEQCDGDIKLVDFFVNLGEDTFPEFKYKWLASEMKKNIPKELNFVSEGANANRMREYFKHDKHIKIPIVYDKYTSDRVLIMEFIEGVPINKTQKLKELGLNLKDVAYLLAKNFTEQIFEYGFVHADPHPGNVFVNVKKDKKGNPTGKPEIILLDHGLYKELPEDTKIAYSYLWKGILSQNQNMMKESSEALGIKELYPLLVAMITNREYNDIMNKNEKDLKKRLRPPQNAEERKIAQENGQKFMKEILFVLHSVNQDLLLLFKTNDFLRSLDNQLGSPINNFELMAKYCFRVVEKDMKKNRKLTLTEKISLSLEWVRTYVGLQIQKLLITLFPGKYAV